MKTLHLSGISGHTDNLLKKITIALFIITGTFSFVYAQVPNGSFENGINNVPTGWRVMNNAHRITSWKQNTSNGSLVIGPADGQYFMQMTTDSPIAGNPMPLFGLMSAAIATTESPDSIVFNRMYFPKIADDNFLITIMYSKYDSATQKSNIVMSASTTGSKRDSAWKRESSYIFYFGNTRPAHDSLFIIISSSNPSQHDPNTMQGKWGIGATLLLDNFRLVGKYTNGINEMKVDFGIASSVYPNPSSGDACITFALEKAATAFLQLIDAEGRVLRNMENISCSSGSNTVHMDTKGLIPGIYFYRISSGNKNGGGKILVKE